jgi:peptidoglycan hydrolase-like protein with peptidoglycan-binding domain
MDPMVLKAQQWVNATYGPVSGYVRCAEDGSTGWQTMYSLTRALQHELGITGLSDTFGPTTLSKLTAYGNVGLSSANLNMRRIAEAALYCKGYSGGGIDGGFGSATQAGLSSALTNMGIAATAPYSVAPKVFKALLTMDAYVLLNGGNADVQAAQRWLNSTFYQRAKFFIGPCDGHYSRNVQIALAQALQYSMGLGDSGADGNIGAGTQAAMKAQATVSTTAGQPIFVQLFRAAMTFNNQPNVWQNASATFTEGLAAAVREFQAFCRLVVNGAGDYETWMSLLLSTGDPARTGTAVDVMYPLTSATIATVKANGYQMAGRYLTGGTNKVLTNSEIALIFANDMAFFPLYQEFGNAVTYFSYDQGFAAGQAAYAAAKGFTIPVGTTIYFSVDFDALDTEVASAVIPHFRGINDAMNDDYAIGVYGCRNVCIQLAEQGLTSSSFVSGMSWGYSGNLGYPLPANWAFDQISNRNIGSGAGLLEIDNDIVSGRDPGVRSVSRPPEPNDRIYTYLIWLEARAAGYLNQGNLQRQGPELVAQYLRKRHDRYEFTGAQETFGQLDQNWIDYVDKQKNMPDYGPMRDAVLYRDCDLEHFGASFGAVVNHEVPGPSSARVNLADIGGWGGDLVSVLGSFCVAGLPPEQAYDFARDSIATLTDTTYFSMGDMLADVDAMVFGERCKADSTVLLSKLFQDYYSDRTASIGRFTQFAVNRFGVSRDDRITAASAIFFDDSDSLTVVARNALWTTSFLTSGYAAISLVPNAVKTAVAEAFADVITELADR